MENNDLINAQAEYSVADKRRAFGMLSIALVIVTIIMLVLTVISHNGFIGAQVGSNNYQVVQANVINIEKQLNDENISMKPATSNMHKYIITLQYDNKRYTITTTLVDFATRCANAQVQNNTIEVYMVDGQLYETVTTTVDSNRTNKYLFFMGASFVCFIATAMVISQYFTLKKQNKGEVKDEA